MPSSTEYFFDTSKGKHNVTVSASDLRRDPMAYYDVCRRPSGFLAIGRLVANEVVYYRERTWRG